MLYPSRIALFGLTLAVGLSVAPCSLDAQGLKGLKERAKAKIADKAVDKVLGDDSPPAEKAREAEPARAPAPTDKAAPAAAEGAFVNFDFVPGERVLFAEDFSRDHVGDFPRRLEFVRGNMEIAEWQGGRWLRGTTWPSAFAITLPETLPERFTVEMEVVPGRDNSHMSITFAEKA